MSSNTEGNASTTRTRDVQGGGGSNNQPGGNTQQPRTTTNEGNNNQEDTRRILNRNKNKNVADTKDLRARPSG